MCTYVHHVIPMYVRTLSYAQDVDVGVAKLSLSWSTTAHRCLYLTASHLLEDIKLIRGTLPVAQLRVHRYVHVPLYCGRFRGTAVAVKLHVDPLYSH